MSLSEKAKTRCELGFACATCNNEDPASCGMLWKKEKWVRLEDARQEIDKARNEQRIKDAGILQKHIDEDHAGWARERGEQKQKLQTFYDTLIAILPKTVKIEEYDSATKESWIVHTANPSEWDMFTDALDGWLLKFKELVK